LLLTECVEPRLGCSAPTILCDYPASQAALAVVRAEEPPVAERFELYVRGVELANGYHELLDADVLRRRNVETNTLRAVDGKPSLPIESRLLTAMDRGLPSCCGVALGFDRVVMLAAGAATIQEVLAFPIDRA
jgi:elongation factor P--(R)-beta-lysine ligase